MSSGVLLTHAGHLPGVVGRQNLHSLKAHFLESCQKDGQLIRVVESQGGGVGER
jgi:hypothetical protein